MDNQENLVLQPVDTTEWFTWIIWIWSRSIFNNLIINSWFELAGTRSAKLLVSIHVALVIVNRHVNFMSCQALTEAAGHARMRKMQKVCSSKCMVFSVSLLSHASVTPNFKHRKLLHVCNWLKQVPWQLHVKRPSYSRLLLPANSTVIRICANGGI